MYWPANQKSFTFSEVNRIKSKSIARARRYSHPRAHSIQMNKQSFLIYKPGNWGLTVLKNSITSQRVAFFYSNYYYFRISLPNSLSKVMYDSNSSTLVLHTLYLHNSYRLFWSTMKITFMAFYKPFFKKLKFKGKGYYIYKNKRNTITPQFGYSHRLYLYSHFTSVKFLSKTSIFVFGLLKSDVIKTAMGIKAMRPINIFTGRGVRFSKQIVYKKVGKVSSYR